MQRRSLAHWCASIAWCLFCGTAALAAPPVARTVDVTDRQFGLVLPDPYRWMEGVDNVELRDWLRAQGAQTRGQLETSPQLAGWQRRLRAASGATTVNRLQRRFGGRIFFLRIEGDQRGALMVRERDGRERMLLDPNSLSDAAGPASVTEYSPSPDGSLVAVNVDRGGAEVTTVSLIDVDTGVARTDVLESIWGEFPVIWLADGSGFSYTQMAPRDAGSSVDPMLNMRVRVHRLGQPVQDDPISLAAGRNPGFVLAPQEFPVVDATVSSDWAVATASGARPEMRLCVARRDLALVPDASWRCLVDYADQVQGYSLHGSKLYLLSAKNAPNGRVLALDLDRPTPRLRDAQVVLPESRAHVLTGMAMARDGLYVRRMSKGMDGFVRLPFQGGRTRPLAMPMPGTAFLMSAQPGEDGLLFTVQNWTHPRSLFAYDPAIDRIDDLHLGATSPGDYSAIVAIETEAISADGTPVPLSIIHRQDVVRDGKAMVILEGYGSYGISQQPYFDPNNLEWVQAGHVFAVAHVRGGGENGASWWQSGKGPNKGKGVEDFIACARQLVVSGFTTAPRLAASGASAGGLLIGGAITRAPQQFGAAVIHAGMLNPVRLLVAANGSNQFAELGDPHTPAGLKALRAMDPYQRVRAGRPYPAVLLSVGTNDNRVSPWESAKFGARLAAASSSGKPVWFRVSDSEGHFAGSLNDEAAELADTYSFLELQLAAH